MAPRGRVWPAHSLISEWTRRGPAPLPPRLQDVPFLTQACEPAAEQVVGPRSKTRATFSLPLHRGAPSSDFRPAITMLTNVAHFVPGALIPTHQDTQRIPQGSSEYKKVYVHVLPSTALNDQNPNPKAN